MPWRFFVLLWIGISLGVGVLGGVVGHLVAQAFAFGFFVGYVLTGMAGMFVMAARATQERYNRK
jgi:hypothetical protein